MSIRSLNKYFKDHDLQDLNYGKTYKYSLDKSFIKPYLNGDRFIFQTPMLFIPYKARHVDSYNTGSIGTDNWQLDASLYNKEHDPDIDEFTAWLRGLEDTIYKGLRRRSNLGITRGGHISILKNDDYHDCFKLGLKLDTRLTHFFLLEGLGKIGPAFDFKTDLKAPCYGVFIIEVASIWVRRNRTVLDTLETGPAVSWGLSFIVHAAQCLSSHVGITPVPVTFVDRGIRGVPSAMMGGIPPPPPMPPTVSSLPPAFEKMLKMGVPLAAVHHKMKMQGLDVPGAVPAAPQQGVPKITASMLGSVVLKKATAGEPGPAKKPQRPEGAFVIQLDELLAVRGKLKKPVDTGQDTYSKLFKPMLA